jgi:hypothetical protein
MTWHVVLWRRLDVPGHEVARLTDNSLSGTAIFIHERQPVMLEYSIECDRAWRTISAEVSGFVGTTPIEHRIEATAGVWRLDETPVPEVDGCVDVDLNFSPSTNLLPIRRCAPEVGEEVVVTAAWLRFPSFRLEPLIQRYRRTGPRMYEYESGGGSFRAVLEVDDNGFVQQYGDIWTREV